jgi:uncharacterized protein YggE
MLNYTHTCFSAFLLTLLTITAAGQSKIESLGMARLSVKPDVGVLMITMNVVKADMNEAISTLNSQTNDFVEKFKNQTAAEILSYGTNNFSVRVNMIYNPRGAAKDSGFVASQQLEFKFKNSVEAISKVLSSFPEKYQRMHFNLSFQLSDLLRLKSENQLLQMATKDAMQKSELLAASAKKNLGQILEIRRGTIQGNMSFAQANGGMLNEVVVTGGPFNANDVILSDKVLVVYEIR